MGIYKRIHGIIQKTNIQWSNRLCKQVKKKEINNYPNHLANYLKKNFFPEYRKFLRFMENDYKRHLDSTNNKLENFNGNTRPKHEKRSYITMQG